MKKTLWPALALVVFTPTLLAALDLSDPRDEVYRWLDLWRASGYLQSLPLLRPYPAQFVVSALREVAERGDAASAQRARQWLGELDHGLRVGAEAYHATRATQEDYYGISGAFLTADGRLADLVTASGRMGGIVVTQPGTEEAWVPGEREPVDYFVDWSAVEVRGITLLPTMSATGAIAVGTDRLWLQTGYNRHSFGPFEEGPVLSPQAREAGHLSLTWRGPSVTYTDFLLALSATTDTGDAFGENGSVDVYPNKYLAGHSLQFSPAPWLELAVFETVVYGERFDPVYLVPGVPRTYLSIITGAIDNMMLGLAGSIRLPEKLSLDLMLYADDLHFLDMLAFDFDTKYKIAGQAGISWTPMRRLLKRVSLDYALVTPYTYTHRRESIQDLEDTYDAGPPPSYYANGINYYNYSHAGRSLVALDPNSDRLRLQVLLAPSDRLEVGLAASYRRHANATPSGAYGSGTWATGTDDGGINDNGYIPDGDHLFEEVAFLSQDVIEHILLLGASASWRLPLARGEARVEAGYTLEMAWNKRGSDPNDTRPIEGNDVVLHHLSLGLRYAF